MNDDIVVIQGQSGTDDARLLLQARPYRIQDEPTVPGICLDMRWRMPSTTFSMDMNCSELSVLVFLERQEVQDFAKQLESLYAAEASQSLLQTYDDPQVNMCFTWYDQARAMAKFSGQITIRGLGQDSNSDSWRTEWRIENFCFESFHLQRISKLILSALEE